jgi:uncharacterized protein
MKVCLALILLSFSWMAGAADVPFLSGRVVDHANLLSAEAKTRIGTALKAHEDKTTNQLVILTIPSLDGESIEPFAIKVFEKWKPGRKGKDNGAILIVVPQERKLRIEVQRHRAALEGQQLRQGHGGWHRRHDRVARGQCL